MAEILLLLLAKHIICDYFFQEVAGYTKKHIYLHRHGIEHAALHAVSTFLVLYVLPITAPMVFVVALLDGVIHYHIDWTKLNIQGPAPNIFRRVILTIIDQALHVTTYVAFAQMLVA